MKRIKPPVITWTKRRGEPNVIDGQPGNFVIRVKGKGITTSFLYRDGVLLGAHRYTSAAKNSADRSLLIDLFRQRRK